MTDVLPIWLQFVANTSLALAMVSAVAIAIHLARHPQKMWIMNVVWPVTALFGSVLILWFYFASLKPLGKHQTPMAQAVAKASLHCGAGCTLGDIVAETIAATTPAALTWFGWHSLFDEKIFAVWVLDYLFAFAIGIAFQYFTIKPMRHLSVGAGIVAAVKADTLSLTSWQVGMYAIMGATQFALFRGVYGVSLEPISPVFWFVMQIAMLAGFATSYPVNWFLVRAGLKERM